MNGPSALQYHMLLSGLHTETGTPGQSLEFRAEIQKMHQRWTGRGFRFVKHLLLLSGTYLSPSSEVGLIFSLL